MKPRNAGRGAGAALSPRALLSPRAARSPRALLSRAASYADAACGPCPPYDSRSTSSLRSPLSEQRHLAGLVLAPVEPHRGEVAPAAPVPSLQQVGVR